MSDTTIDTAEAAAATDEAPEVTETDTGTTDETPQEGDDDEPDWRKDFDADKAAERIRKLQSEARNLRSRAKEAEEKAKGADEKDGRISTLEAENLRLSVGYELGLPRELVGRLQGSTRDELIADAEALVKLVRPGAVTSRKPVEALPGGGQPEREPEETDLDKLGSRMFRR